MFGEASEAHKKKEKEKARELRKSRWWQNKLQAPQCYYCQQFIDKKQATMDHIVPISRGGTSTKGNVVVCCKDCNTKKRDLTAVEWEEFVSDALKNKKDAT